MDYSFLPGGSFPAPVPASSSPRLERGYRWLVACYPRSFRRENTEEIIAVLLATARVDQRRPTVAEAATLLRGALRMRTAMPRPPRSVRSAVRLMCLGAVVQLAALITTLVTVGSIRAAARMAALHQGRAAVANMLALLNYHLFAGLLVMPCLIVGWLLVAWANARGYDWSRAVALLAFLFYTAGLIFALAQGSAAYAPAALAASGAVWVIGLIAFVLLVVKQSWPHYARLAPSAAGSY